VSNRYGIEEAKAHLAVLPPGDDGIYIDGTAASYAKDTDDPTGERILIATGNVQPVAADIQHVEFLPVYFQNRPWCRLG
jgi:hypothetical protein